jgi:crossover junction endodeoxyribonuclease RuvC
LVAADLTVAEYTALPSSRALSARDAPVKQVQDMVQRLLMLSGTPSPDAADALGVAICHAHSGEALATLSAIAPELAKKVYV